MGKKKSEQPAVVNIPVHDPETVKEARRDRIYKEAEVEWDRAFGAANTEYGVAMNTAWQKYITALRADPTKPGDKGWGKERDYDRQYDADREAGLNRFNAAMLAADLRCKNSKSL